MSRFPHMQEFEVEGKPQNSGKKAPVGYYYDADGIFLRRNAEGWGKEDHINNFITKDSLIITL